MGSINELPSLDFEYSHITPVNKIYSTLYFLKLLVIIIGQILKNKLKHYSRGRKEIIEAYDNVTWKKVFDSKTWKNSRSLVDFMFPKFATEILNPQNKKFMLLSNRFCKVSPQEFARYRPIPVLENLKKYTNSDDTIVELGSGWGRNLFFLVALNFKNKLEGYEFTKHGVKAAKEINEHFGCNIKFGEIDLTKNFDFIDLKGKSIFTQKVMEQLKYDTDVVIENLIKAKPKQVMHVEPIAELYSNSFRDQVSRLYIKSADYQDNLLTTLRAFEKNGKLKILEVRRLGFGANPFHEDSFIRWIPKSNS